MPGSLLTLLRRRGPAVETPAAFSSAEVGNVDASTVVVTFTKAVSGTAAAGATIVVAGSGRAINSATIVGSTIRYVLASAVTAGQAVTYAYSQATGDLVTVSNSLEVEDITAQAVTNNVGSETFYLLTAGGDTLTTAGGDRLVFA